MSVIAWDGKSIVADRMMAKNDMSAVTTKIFRINDNEVLSFAGELGQGLTLVEWYKSGAIVKDYPEFQKTKDWTRLIVASDSGCFFFDNLPIALTVEDKFHAWGCGGDVAMGAMGAGATAREAVEITCKHNVFCGNGIDEFDLTS